MKLLQGTTAIAAGLSLLAVGAAAQESGSKLASGDYCATVWNKVDANDDGLVSRQEASDDIELRFSSIDTDDDGNITRVEYIDCQTGKSAPAVSPVDRDEETFRSADTNSDDQLDRQEFADATRGAYEGSRAGVDDESYKSFSSYTGLTEEEAGSADTAIRDMSADEAAFRASMNFNALDENGDDIVDTQEWSNRNATPSRDKEWAEARFDRLDSDSSGSISEDEYANARATMIDEITTATTTFESDVNKENSAEKTESGSDASNGDQGIPVFIYYYYW